MTSNGYVEVLQVLEDHGWHWTAWDLHPYAGPRLISDWNYTPTPSFGKWVKLALAGKQPRHDLNAVTQDAGEVAATSHPGNSGPVGLFEAHGDVGEVRHGGLATVDAAAKAYTVSGSGENMWFGKDAFHYAWRQVSGDLASRPTSPFSATGLIRIARHA